MSLPNGRRPQRPPQPPESNFNGQPRPNGQPNPNMPHNSPQGNFQQPPQMNPRMEQFNNQPPNNVPSQPRRQVSSEDMLNKIQNEQEQYRPKSNLIRNGIIVLGCLAVLAGGGYMVYKALPQNQKIEKTNNGKIEQVSKSNSENTIQNTPIDLPDWAKKSYGDLTDEDKKALREDQRQTFIGAAAIGYPSLEDGFTNDKAKEYDENGLPNIYFTRLTEDSVAEQLALIVNRVINPVFGGWTKYQYPNMIGTNPRAEELSNLLSNISTPEYLDSLIEDENKRPPFFFDFDNNDYNGALTGVEPLKEISKNETERHTVREARFVGTIRDGELSVGENETMNLDFIVDYRKSNNEIFKTKKVHLNLVVNDDGEFKINGGEQSDL